MKGFDVLHVKSAVKSRNKFDLSFSHLTTMDFGQIVPLCVQETIPGDKFDISSAFFSRMAPLVKPTYGKFQFKTVCGYVPYHQVADDIEAWLAGKTTWEGSTPVGRFIIANVLFNFLTSSDCMDQATSVADADIVWKNSSGTDQFGKFTAYGRFVSKVFTALGYPIPQGVDLRTSSDWYLNERNFRFSALPLLSFFKLYNDYMSQSQRFNTSQLTDALRKIKHGIVDSNLWNASAGVLYSPAIKLFFDNLKLAYENDYFTSAWQLPNQPLANSENISTVEVPGITRTGVDDIAMSDGSDNYFYSAVSGTSARINQRSLDMLRMFDNWVRRNNYSGSRAVQQIYSRFGIKTDDYRTNYAHVLKTDSFPIQVGDVTSQSDTTGALLGEYAGKGIMSAGVNDQFTADDYGCFFILGYFTVSPMMAYGADRRVLRTQPLDFYNPEFDGLGADAISYGEVFQNPLGLGQSDTTSNLSVYGFTERYNSYRYGRDVISGEFRDYHDTSGNMNVWHSGRLLNDVRKSNNMVAQSSSMNTLSPTDSEYNRIFSITNDSLDHFYLTCRFKIDAYRNMLNLNQVCNLGEGDTEVPRNGNVIS